jgi:predicted ester cyclase
VRDVLGEELVAYAQHCGRLGEGQSEPGKIGVAWGSVHISGVMPAAFRDSPAGLFTPVPDASYEVRSFAVDDARQNVAAYAVFRGTHTGEGGPVPPTGKKVEADYVYVMDFDGDRIRHLTKIWNDGISLTQLGWT